MPVRNDQPAYDDTMLRLQRRIDSLEKQLKALQAGSRVSVPIYDATTMSELDTNDGEVWITGDNLYFQSSGNVQQVTSN